MAAGAGQGALGQRRLESPRVRPQGHPFDGDGMIHAAEFRDGRVTVRNRWVRTDAVEREAAAGAATCWSIRDTALGNPGKPLREAANTDLVGHAGKALALWYLSGDAYEIDPLALQTLGKQPAIAATFGKISAHAKVDEATGGWIGAQRIAHWGERA